MLLVIVLAVMITLALSPAIMAQPLDERKQEAERDVEKLQERLEDAVERYNFACSKLEETRARIQQNEAELAEAEKELATNKKRLNDRVRAIYVTRHNEFLDVVVNAGNFDEFLVGLDLVKKVGQKDAELVKEVKEAKARLEAAKQALAEQKGEQEAAKSEMASSKAGVESELSQAKGKLAGVEGEIRQGMARRAAEASTTTSGRRSYPVYNPVRRRTKPPGEPNSGVVSVAYACIGYPYVWGAAGPYSFDCSGLTQYCYRVGAGKSITHSSYGQAYCGTPVSVSELQPGDILGFRGWGHVGIYIGNDQYIHAPHSGAVVRIGSLSARRNYCGAVRP